VRRDHRRKDGRERQQHDGDKTTGSKWKLTRQRADSPAPAPGDPRGGCRNARDRRDVRPLAQRHSRSWRGVVAHS
jgi:hypothetical protein